ncbi:hypothetical protein GS531_18885 [Rhodococcus hoagii]|nr:hypothetical protein [Prescottella equi]
MSTASAAPTVNAFQIPLVVNTGIWACSGIHTFCAYTPVAITGEVPGMVTFPARYPGGAGTSGRHGQLLPALAEPGHRRSRDVGGPEQ